MPANREQTLSATGGASTTITENPKTILARGQARTSFAKVVVIGIVLGILATGGIVAWIVKPESAKDIWLIIGPIISGTLGFLAGRKTDGNG